MAKMVSFILYILPNFLKHYIKITRQAIVKIIIRWTELMPKDPFPLKYWAIGTSLVAQWVRLHAPNAGGPGSIPGQGTRSHMQAMTKSSHATTKEPMCRN